MRSFGAPSTSAARPTHVRTKSAPRHKSRSRAAPRAADDPQAWERFYLTHSKDGAKGHDVGAFKDRHYLRKAFGELVDEEARAAPETFRPALRPSELPDVDETRKIDVLELGCGVGNSVFPLLRANLKHASRGGGLFADGDCGGSREPGVRCATTSHARRRCERASFDGELR
jgi:methyltransferase-like protein 6